MCPAGYPTIGYGATFYEDGTRVAMKDPPIAEWQADALLMTTLWSFRAHALRLSPVLGGELPPKLGAITSFVFNLGPTAYGGSTLRRRINARDWDRAVLETKRWNKGGGRILAGLVARRSAEAALLTQGE